MSDSDSLDGVDFDRIVRNADRRRFKVAEDRKPPSFFDESRLGRERYGAPARISGRRYLGDPIGSELVPRVEIEPARRRRRSSTDSLDRALNRLDLARRSPSLRRRHRHLDIEVDDDKDYILVDGLRGRNGWRGTTTIERSISRGQESVSVERRRSRSRRRLRSTVREESVHRYRRESSPIFPRSHRSSPFRTRRDVVLQEIEPRQFFLPRRRSYHSLRTDIRALDALHVDRFLEVRRDYRAPSPRVIRAMMATLT